MDYRQICIDTMTSSKYKGMTLEELKGLFDLSNAKEFTSFMKMINEAEEECIFVVDAKGRYFLAEKLGYFKGILRMNPRGFGFVENESISCFIGKDDLNHALDGDEVIARILGEQEAGLDGIIVKIVAHNLKNVVGTIKIRDGRKIFLPDSDTLAEKIKITNLDEHKLINDMKVLVKITGYEPRLKGEIEKIIGYKYDPGVDILSLLYEHDIHPEFSDEVMAEVNKIHDHVTSNDRKGRKNLTYHQIITIDGEDSRDLDDAISVEKLSNGYRLGVHIADVSHYVKAGSAIDLEALERGTSVYVTDRVVPMLPQALSNGICSLNEGVERCTITCEMEIDSKGDITNYQIYPSLIKTTHRMTYTKVNQMIHGDEYACEEYEDILEMVHNMVELSQIIRAKRVNKGAIDFDIKEGKVLVDKDGKPVDVVVRERGEAERIIEDFMVQANECVASHMKWQSLPSIYRIHETPDAKKMREFVGIASLFGVKFKGNVINVKPKQCQKILEEAKGKPWHGVLAPTLLRCMAKAKYDPKCLGHFGLALQEYTHFTSPIRRYPDLIVHRMLWKYCFNDMPDSKTMHKDEKWIEKAALQCSERERRAVLAERDVDDMKKAEYMEKRIGNIYNGTISSVTKFGVFVELDNTVEGLVHVSNMSDDHYVFDEKTRTLVGLHTHNRYMMGQSVKVKCVDASRFKKQVDFILVKEKGKQDEKVVMLDDVPAPKRMSDSRPDRTRSKRTDSSRRESGRNHREKGRPSRKLHGRGR